MAIKISGNTVIDDSQNITSTGSATISGRVLLGPTSNHGDEKLLVTGTASSVVGNSIFTLQRGSNAGDGDGLGQINFADTRTSSNYAQIFGAVDGTPGANDFPGRLSFNTAADGASSPSERMRIDSSGDVKIGGTLPSAPNISLNADGSITNKNFINVRNENSSLGGVYIGNADGNAARNNVAFEISPTLTSNDAKVRLNYDGSASFAGVVTGTADYNTFTASVTLANEGTSFRSTESSAGSASKYHFFGSANGTNFCNIATDGSATFAGGDAVINSYGQLVITRSDSNAFPSLTINSAGTTTNTIDLNGDGSATFASSVECNTELRLIRGSNRVNLGGSDTHAVFENTGNFIIYWDGSASFDGTITAAGYSLANLNTLP